MKIKQFFEWYIFNVKNTESVDFESMRIRLLSDEKIRMLHSVFGISTEAGEILDMLKKHIFYGKPLDLVNLKEELGDLMWYVAVIIDECGFDFEEILNLNIKKLQERYKGKFSSEKAINRDLEKERQLLENKLNDATVRVNDSIRNDQRKDPVYK